MLTFMKSPVYYISYFKKCENPAGCGAHRELNATKQGWEVSTRSGLVRVDGQKNDRVLFGHFMTDDGSEFISSHFLNLLEQLFSCYFVADGFDHTLRGVET